MKFAAGDMVTPNPMMADEVLLYNEPPSPQSNFEHVSFLSPNNTAIVVSLSSADAKCVYIIGPNGAGWTFGAYLKMVK